MGFHIRLNKPPTYPLHPVNPNNACPLRSTAAAGTELAGASSHSTVSPQSYSLIGRSSRVTEVYDPKTFIPHAASHRQTFVHCERFSTAASRRSLGSVSVPMWLTILSDQLPVKSLGGPLPHQQADRTRAHPPAIGPVLLRGPHFLPHPHAGAWSYSVLARLSAGYSQPEGKLLTHYSPFCHYPLRDRSTCMPNPRRQRSL